LLGVVLVVVAASYLRHLTNTGWLEQADIVLSALEQQGGLDHR